MADENPDEKQEEPQEESKPEPKVEGEDDKGNVKTTYDSKEKAKEERIADHNAKQAEKLAEKNKELKEDKDKANQKYQNLIESLKPKEEIPAQAQQQYKQPINQAPTAQNFQNLNQQDINDVFKGMVDDQGYLDGNKLVNVLTAMNQRADRAEQAVRQSQKTQADFEQSAKSKELHTKYPQLDPENEDFNKDFYDLVRNEVIGQMMEGKEDALKAADKWYNKVYKDQEVNKADTAKKVEAEDQKRSINAVRPRSPILKGYYETEKDENLRKAVIAGKKGALAEMLKRHEEKLSQ